MTDRYNALTVVLDRDIRSDDCEPLIAAIQQLRGVLSVTPNVSDFDDHVAFERARLELRTKLLQALEAKP